MMESRSERGRFGHRLARCIKSHFPGDPLICSLKEQRGLGTRGSDRGWDRWLVSGDTWVDEDERGFDRAGVIQSFL